MTPDQDMIVSEERLRGMLAAMDVGPFSMGDAIALKTPDARAIITELLALRPKEAGQVGDWVLVPREPTDEMNRAYTVAKYEGPKPTLISDLWRAMLAAAPSPPASPAVTVGVKGLDRDDRVSALRGTHMDCATFGCGNKAAWHFEVDGVGSNYCDDCLTKIKALTSPPGETAQVGATDDITVRLDNLAQSLAGEYPPHTLMDLAEAASLITTLRLSAKESPEQLREAVIEAATLLLERLDDFESELDGDDTYREYGGHVAPAKSRLRAALKETGK